MIKTNIVLLLHIAVKYSTTICIRIKDITLHIYPLYNKTLIVIALCMYPEVLLILMCEPTMGLYLYYTVKSWVISTSIQYRTFNGTH